MIQKKIMLFLFFGVGLNAQGGTAATQLASIDPTAGGSIDSAGSYYLGYPIAGDVTINASEVTLDLNGQVVSGEISISGSLENVTITNGIAQNVTVNDGCNNVTFSRLTLASSTSSPGISAVGTPLPITNLTIEHVSTQSVMGDACSLVSCQNILIADTICTDSVNGIVIDTCSDGQIVRCYMSNNTLDGVNVSASNRITFMECISALNGTNGFSLNPMFFTRTDDIVFFNCIADGNTTHGFFGEDALTGLLLDNCLAQNNGTNDEDAGYFVGLGLNVEVQECIAFNNKTGFSSSGGVGPATSNYAYKNDINYTPGFFEVSPTDTDAQFWRNITDT